MTEITAEQAYKTYAEKGVGSATLLARSEFDDFWHALDNEGRHYWMQQFRRGPTGLSKELLAGFASPNDEPLDPELLRSIGERLRSLGTLSETRR